MHINLLHHSVLTTLCVVILQLGAANAQWQVLQQVLRGGTAAVKENFVYATRKAAGGAQIHNITMDNYRSSLGDSTVDWLVYFTADDANCKTCKEYDDAFKEVVTGLKNYDIFFGKVNCDSDPLLCNIFAAWNPGHVYYITHSDTPSTAVTVPGMPPTHKTHIREVPFHAHGAPPIVKEGTPSNEAEPYADKHFLVTLIRDGKWKEYDEWDSWSQPFQGWGRYISLFGWFAILQFGKVPTWATMILISLGGRFLTTRFLGGRGIPAPRQVNRPAAPAPPPRIEVKN